ARFIPLTPSHHQCEGRPPAFQPSRATRATNSAVASAAWLEGLRGARYPICGCIVHPASRTPSDFWRAKDFSETSGASRREIAKLYLIVIASQRVARMRAR